MHKASLFNIISYNDVLGMYEKYWFVFNKYCDPDLKGED